VTVCQYKGVRPEGAYRVGEQTASKGQHLSLLTSEELRVLPRKIVGGKERGEENNALSSELLARGFAKKRKE